jgi:molybdopterin converting factor small subunit
MLIKFFTFTILLNLVFLGQTAFADSTQHIAKTVEEIVIDPMDCQLIYEMVDTGRVADPISDANIKELAGELEDKLNELDKPVLQAEQYGELLLSAKTVYQEYDSSDTSISKRDEVLVKCGSAKAEIIEELGANGKDLTRSIIEGSEEVAEARQEAAEEIANDDGSPTSDCVEDGTPCNMFGGNSALSGQDVDDFTKIANGFLPKLFGGNQKKYCEKCIEDQRIKRILRRKLSKERALSMKISYLLKLKISFLAM